MKVDFYIKDDGVADLRWVASTKCDVLDEHVKAAVASKKWEDYYSNLFKSFENDEEHYVPIHGWPWEEKTSSKTDIVFCFVDGRVLANSKGTGWYDPNDQEFPEANPYHIVWEHPFPVMKLDEPQE